MLLRVVLLAAVAVALSGCSGGGTDPTPTPTEESEPRTLRTLIDAPAESPDLLLGAETDNEGFRTVAASYSSEGLTITGVVYIPDGAGPFPGVVVVHGSVNPATFTTGSDLVREQEALARSGHVVFAPDLRGFAESDPDPSDGTDVEIGAVADVVNAGRALAGSGIAILDADRIGLVGHSLGGGESLAAMVVAPDVFDVVAAISPVSSHAWWVVDHYIDRDSAEFEAIVAVHGTYEDDPDHWDDLSSVTFAVRATAPLLIVYGTADDEIFGLWQEHTTADWEAADAAVSMITVDGGDHRLDPLWDEAFPQIIAFIDQTLLV